MSGCDTTSALFNYVKLKFVQTLKNNNDLLKVIEIFKNPEMTPEAVVDVGNRFLVALYGYPITTSDTPSLNNLCYKCYMKSSFNKSSNMAAHQHSLKVYYQIQYWLGNKKRPGEWGWERINSELQPVKTLKSPAPDSILYARYPASVRRGAQEIAAVGRSDCFVQCCILIVGATAITEGFK
ncbi:hypothetical protein AVEN_69511-1 [Araneus ventricosus]|uniref:Uncharacterized protein n=1 Tax=Araneus ventricosus TaxID=182803 RepID=A0A4Y2DAK5_ARAVE|nr:hypothetical protein AVEN_69511-1 [Araneus ventricosus]